MRTTLTWSISLKPLTPSLSEIYFTISLSQPSFSLQALRGWGKETSNQQQQHAKRGLICVQFLKNVLQAKVKSNCSRSIGFGNIFRTIPHLRPEQQYIVANITISLWLMRCSKRSKGPPDSKRETNKWSSPFAMAIDFVDAILWR